MIFSKKNWIRWTVKLETKKSNNLHFRMERVASIFSWSCMLSLFVYLFTLSLFERGQVVSCGCNIRRLCFTLASLPNFHIITCMFPMHCCIITMLSYCMFSLIKNCYWFGVQITCVFQELTLGTNLMNTMLN